MLKDLEHTPELEHTKDATPRLQVGNEENTILCFLQQNGTTESSLEDKRK